MNAEASAPPYMRSGPTNSNREFKLTHSESPLDTLVRRTSSRKPRNGPHRNQTHLQQPTQKPLIWEPYRPRSHNQAQRDVGDAVSSKDNVASPRHPQQKPKLLLNLDQSQPSITSDTPHSPLLHSHFPTRDSVVSGSTYYDDSFDGGSHQDSIPYDGIHEHSQFSSVDTWRDSSKRQSGSGDNSQELPAEVQQKTYVHHTDDRSNLNRPMVDLGSDVRHSDFLDYYLDRPDGCEEDLPTVIVSSPDDNPPILRGRAPMIKPVMANFSRPLRDSGQWHGADAIAERVTPQLPPHMRDQKRAVLERNATKQTSKTASIVSTSSYKPSPLSKEMIGRPSEPGQNVLAINTMAQPGVVQLSPYNPIPLPDTSMLQPHPSSKMRSASPSSIYSNYSYYQYEGLLPSPVLTGRETTTSTPTDNWGPSPVRARSPNADRERTPMVSPTENRGSQAIGTQTAQNFLLLGIEHHEANRLQESARCFERSAKEGGGCGVGMLMYGLSLRHGWGCPKNEALGFKWVRKAAESAVEDLEQLRVGNANIDKGSIQAELVLAIYEVGQCFFHGWGVAKDQKMGFSYYMVAARLGDGDAQGDLAFCLSNGKGCKKNKKEAARWYRAAVQQGQSDVGLAWIYKDKYQD